MKILVVDDNKVVQEKVVALLASQGHCVDSANNGLDALSKAQEAGYELFVIDHLMPLMNGVQLTKNFKSSSSLSHVPVVFMTTQGTSTLKELAEFSLFDKVIDKPINDQSFLMALEDFTGSNIDYDSQQVNA